jgi:hypothetical protein
MLLNPAPGDVQAASAQASSGAATSKIPPRPSLDVAMDSLKLLRRHVFSFCARLKGWSLNKLAPESALRFTGAIADLEAAVEQLGMVLAQLQHENFVAKATVQSRLRALLAPGSRVKLHRKSEKEFLAFYTQDELDNLQVVRVSSSHAILKTGDREVGLVKLSFIDPDSVGTPCDPQS